VPIVTAGGIHLTNVPVPDGLYSSIISATGNNFAVDTIQQDEGIPAPSIRFG
jgi:hypothetical protein